MILPLERQREITLQSATVSFEMNGVPFYVLELPCHPAFTTGVEGMVHVLDSMALVSSAIEGTLAGPGAQTCSEAVLLPTPR